MSLSIRAALAAAAAFAAGTATAETVGGLAHADAVAHTDRMEQTDPFTLEGDEDLTALAPMSGAGDTITAIVEIPAGTSAKWEIDPEDPQSLYWEYEEGAPRIVQYLGYPGNYGSIPGTALPEDLGGDGDPLDVIVLGQAAPRGARLDIRLIGVLKMTDEGQQDDKLLGVMTENTPFAEVESLAALDESFPGASEIVATWFTNYKGPDGGMENQGYADAEEARAIFDQAVRNYESASAAAD